MRRVQRRRGRMQARSEAWTPSAQDRAAGAALHRIGETDRAVSPNPCIREPPHNGTDDVWFARDSEAWLQEVSRKGQELRNGKPPISVTKTLPREQGVVVSPRQLTYTNSSELSNM